MRSCLNWAVQVGKKHPNSLRISRVLLSALPAGGMITEVIKLLTEYSLETVQDLADEQSFTELIDNKISQHYQMSEDKIAHFRAGLLESLDSIISDVTNRLENYESELKAIQEGQSELGSELKALRSSTSQLEQKLELTLQEIRRDLDLQNQKIKAFGHQQDELFSQQSQQALEIAQLREVITHPENRQELSLDILDQEAFKALTHHRYQMALDYYSELQKRTMLPKYELFHVIAFLLKNPYKVLQQEQADEIWDKVKIITRDPLYKTSALMILNELRVKFYDIKHISVRFPPTHTVLNAIKSSPPPQEIHNTLRLLIDFNDYQIN